MERGSVSVPTDLIRRRLLAGGAAISATVALARCRASDREPNTDSDAGNDVGERGYDTNAGGDEESAPETQRLHVPRQHEPAHDYDPIVSNDAPSVRILNHLFNGLYKYDDGLDLRPKLTTGDPDVEKDERRYLVQITDRA